MKNNIEFYQHYVNADQHPKFKMLRVQYGWSGEGKFWALNNRIGLAENCCLDISKKYNKAAIASDLGMKIKDFDKFIDFLRGDCELVRECEPGIITTDLVQETLERVSKKRIRNQSDYSKNLKASESKIKKAERNVQTSENIHSIVEDSIVDKSKEKLLSDFELFWKMYNKKTDRKKCLSKFKKLKQSDIDLIFKTLPAYINSTPDIQFRKNPITYLNNESWNDEIIKPKNNHTGFKEKDYGESTPKEEISWLNDTGDTKEDM